MSQPWNGVTFFCGGKDIGEKAERSWESTYIEMLHFHERDLSQILLGSFSFSDFSRFPATARPPSFYLMIRMKAVETACSRGTYMNVGRREGGGGGRKSADFGDAIRARASNIDPNGIGIIFTSMSRCFVSDMMHQSRPSSEIHTELPGFEWIRMKSYDG